MLNFLGLLNPRSLALSDLIQKHGDDAINIALVAVLNNLDKPIRVLFALDGLIEEIGMPRFEAHSRSKQEPDVYRIPLLRHVVAAHFHDFLTTADQANLAAFTKDLDNPDALVDIWLQRYAAEPLRTGKLRPKMLIVALKLQDTLQEQSRAAWSHSILGYLGQDRVKKKLVHDSLLIACYWFEAGHKDRARELLEPLLSDPIMAFSTTCAKPLALITDIRDHLADFAERPIYTALAGDLASIWGLVSEAKEFHTQALQDLDRHDPRFLAVLGQLMRTYQMSEDDTSSEEMIRICERLTRTAYPPLLGAFIHGWRGVAAGALSQDNAALQEAADRLRAATKDMELEMPADLSMQGVAMHERALLMIALAEMELNLRHYSKAIELLEQELQTSQLQLGQLVVARIKSLSA